MKRTLGVGGIAAFVLAVGATGVIGADAAPATPPGLVKSYSALADVILAAKNAEHELVHAILDRHYADAEQAVQAGKWEDAAADMALFANEGDNRIGGVRKRLLEGGHHHNAEGETKGLFEAGYVIVTTEGKKNALAAMMDLRQATTDPARKAAWEKFDAVARGLLGGK